MSKQICQQIDNQIHQMNVTIGVEKTRELRRAYYAAVSFVDNELGRVISEVRMLVLTNGCGEDGDDDDDLAVDSDVVRGISESMKVSLSMAGSFDQVAHE